MTAFSIVSFILCIYKKKIGFLLGSIVNISWFAIDMNYGIYSQAFLFFVYFLLTTWGWFKWSKMEKNRNNVNHPQLKQGVFWWGRIKALL